MKKNEVEINGIKFPANLLLLMGKDESNDYKLANVYYLELVHNLMGFFPAVIINSNRRMVLTTSKKLLIKIWEKLEPRDSKIGSQMFYLHKIHPVGYPISNSPSRQEENVPLLLLNEDEYEKMLKENEKPFKWSPGLLGPSLPEEEFQQIINLASVEK